MNERTKRAALVTGGALRIGRAIVDALAAEGYAVAIHSNRSRADAERACRELQARGCRACVVTGDLSDHEVVLRLIPEAVAVIGPLTLLVNNAGMFEKDGIGELNRALFDRQFAVNLRAPLFMSEAFAAQVPTGDASIVNILDQRVFKPTPYFVSYALAKSALHTATTMLAQALAPGVRVNAVAPGPVLPSPRQDEAAFAAQAAALPLRRGPLPQDVADAVLYLAHARGVSGVTVAVDGGQHFAWQTPDTVGIAE
jgi:NAD(P)-dependent dehydrogenase (short-subunit alcohol dehydrogenase family)